MAKKPWMTSNDLLEAIKRKIMLPTNQNTLSDEDLLRFADEEMTISQVPSVMVYNEEYFVTFEIVTLQPNVTRYPLPERAIGMKLRDVSYADSAGSLFEMTRISPDNKMAYQDNIGTFNHSSKAFWIEGNDVVISPKGESNLVGYLVMWFYLRPNQLVTNDQANIITSYKMDVQVDSSSMLAGDIFSIGGVDFEAVSSSPTGNQFLTNPISALAATNLKNAINNSGLDISAENDSTDTITLSFTDMNLVLLPKSDKFPNQVQANIITTNTNAFIIDSDCTIVFESNVDTDKFEAGTLTDFLETAAGHKTRKYDVEVVSVDDNTMTYNLLDIPITMVPGDYICLQYECIIPQIPSDLHGGFAERTAARILAAIGDQEGLVQVQNKIQEINQNQGELLDNRVEGAPLKISGRHSMLRYARIRRF